MFADSHNFLDFYTVAKILSTAELYIDLLFVGDEYNYHTNNLSRVNNLPQMTVRRQDPQIVCIRDTLTYLVVLVPVTVV